MPDSRTVRPSWCGCCWRRGTTPGRGSLRDRHNGLDRTAATGAPIGSARTRQLSARRPGPVASG